MEVLSVVKL